MKAFLDPVSLETLELIKSGFWESQIHRVIMETSWDLISRDKYFEEIRDLIEKLSKHMGKEKILGFLEVENKEYWPKRRANTEWYLKAIEKRLSKQENPGYLNKDNLRDWILELVKELKSKKCIPSISWTNSLPEAMKENLKELKIGR